MSSSNYNQACVRALFQLANCDAAYPYADGLRSLQERVMTSSDRLVMKSGDSAGGFLFFIGLSTLAILDGVQASLVHNIAIAGLIGTNFTAATLPLLTKLLPRSRTVNSLADPDRINTLASTNYLLFGALYGIDSFARGSIETGLFAVTTASGSATLLTNKLYLTKERLKNWLQPTPTGAALTVDNKIEKIKTRLNYSSLSLRAISYAPLATIDPQHSVVTLAGWTALYCIHRRQHLKIAGQKKQSASTPTLQL